MLVRFLRALSYLHRKAQRSRKAKDVRPSRIIRLFLEPLGARLVPSTATASVSAGTLTIVENSSATPDTITQYGTGDFTIVDSTKTANFTGVTNIVFDANVSNISLTLETPTNGSGLSGNLSIVGEGRHNALEVTFENSFNVKGSVTISNTGIGSSMVVAAGVDTFGSLTVTGGAAVTGAEHFVSIDDAAYNGSITGTLVDLEGTKVNGRPPWPWVRAEAVSSRMPRSTSVRNRLPPMSRCASASAAA